LFKESKKKVQKSLEEYEANQTKYLTIKKALVNIEKLSSYIFIDLQGY